MTTGLPKAGLPAGISTTDLTMPQFIQAHLRRQMEPVDAIPTPFPTWNAHCRDEGGGVGLARAWYAVIGGGTGHGKSLLAENLAAHAMRLGTSPAFLSMEMSTAQLATRLYAILTGTPVSALERGKGFREAEAQSVAAQIAELRERTGARFFCNRAPVHELNDVLSLARHFVEERGVRLLFLDYLQLVGVGDEEQLHREVTKVSRAMRVFAQEMNVTVVALSQYNRTTSTNRLASPIPQGLMGSSSLENDSDQVVLLDHSRYERSPDGETAKTWLLLAKNRHGGTGEIPMEWNYRTLRVREALQDEEDSWPGFPNGRGGR